MYKVKTIINYEARLFETLRDMVTYCAAKFDEEIAFKYRIKPNEEIIEKSFNDYKNDINRLGAILLKKGLLNANIAIIGDNSYSWVTAFMATINGLGRVVPLDKLLAENEVLGLLDRSEANCIFFSKNFINTMKKHKQTSPDVLYICMDEMRSCELDDGFVYYNDLISESIEEDYILKYAELPIDKDETRILLFTSGTTAQSKAVMLSHQNLCFDVYGINSIVKVTPEDSVLSVLPIHHTFECTTGFLTPFSNGATICICDGLRYITKNLEEYKITFFVGVPLIFESIYNRIIEIARKSKKLKTLRFASVLSRLLLKFKIDIRGRLFKTVINSLGGHLKVFISGAAAMPIKISKAFYDFKIRVYQGYGLTETSPVVAGCNDSIFQHGTVGRPFEGIEVAIDAEKENMPGEILVKGPIVAKGYWKDEIATREAFDDGWFRTGDIGKTNSKGNLKITGRIKNMIVLKNGKKIFPEEIEDLIKKIPFIKESMVFGNYHNNGDADICVRLVMDEDLIKAEMGKNWSDEQVAEFLAPKIKDINKQLPHFKAIKYYLFGYKEMTKTTTKKIKRNVEQKNIFDTLREAALSIKEIAGKNFDKLKKH